jgi:hypothetical protein
MTELGRRGSSRERPKLITESPPFSRASGADEDAGVVQRQVWRVEVHELPQLSVEDVQAERRYGGVAVAVRDATVTECCDSSRRRRSSEAARAGQIS